MASWLDTITAPLKTAGEMASQFVEVRDTIKFGEIHAKLQKEIIAAYDAAMQIRGRETALVDENETLKRRVAELEARKAQLDQYELKELPPGVFVRALKVDSKLVGTNHYACNKCHGDGQISPLNTRLVHNGITTLHCSRCDTSINTGYLVRQPPRQARNDWDVFNP